MTVQAGIELDLDIAALIGEMPEVPCESPHHGKMPSHHHGEATHYGRTNHKCEARASGKVVAVCKPFAEHYITQADSLGTCPFCFKVITGREYFEVLGPIK